MEKTKKGDFVEIKFTGYANGQIFDSNIADDLHKINPEAKAETTIVVIGQGMVVSGLDKQLENKELNKEFEVSVGFKEGFGERRRELLRTIPLAAFVNQKINPQPGMVLALDQNIVKIIAVSGARVTADFNNPLAGKNLLYKLTITRFVTDEKERSESLFKTLFRFIPSFEIKEKEILVKGPKPLEWAIKVYKEKFKELIGKELNFEEEKKPEKKLEHKEENSEGIKEIPHKSL